MKIKRGYPKTLASSGVLIVAMILLCLCTNVNAQQKAWSELETEIQALLNKHKVPAAAMAVISDTGILWQHAYGYKDLASQAALTENTVMRMGSISKMFIALGVMKLVEQQQIKLTDKLSSLAPEIQYKNPWQHTHPLRVADLLAHTTGWDGTHFVENAQNHKQPISTFDAVQFHPHSRVSRWAPGTRTAYNNSAPVVAAYLIEKVSGQTFEDFIDSYFFTPLEMHHSDYFYTEHYRNNAATQYVGKRVQEYKHFNNRAAGGLNSPLADMAKFARWLVAPESTPILTHESIKAVQTNQYSHAADQGLELTWGLGSQVFRKNGYVFYGHQGAVRGSSAIIAYQPQLKTAHLVLLNTNSPALIEIHELLAEQQTIAFKKVKAVTTNSLSEAQKSLSGYYYQANPISALTAISRLVSIVKLSADNQNLIVKPVVGGQARLLENSLDGNLIEPTTGKVAMVTIEDPVLGEVLQYGTMTLVNISTLLAWLPLLVIMLWIVVNLSNLLFCLVWLPRLLFNKPYSQASIRLRLWPALHSGLLLILLFTLVTIQNSPDPNVLLAQVSWQSLVIFVVSLLLIIMSLSGLLSGWLYRKQPINRFVYWHSVVGSVVNMLFCMFLGYFGLIGLATWMV